MSGPRVLRAEYLGRREYRVTCALQETLVRRRRRGEIPDTLLLLEHEPVITVGRSAPAPGAPPPRRRSIPIVETSRGGQATYHAPGQLVGYPILDLRQCRCDLHWYLRQLEEVLIRSLQEFGLPAENIPGYTGVWIATNGEPARKIASIGVAVRGWVTYHGFALNVNCDMSGFALIAPCGLRPQDMTRLLDCGVTAQVPALAPLVTRAFGEVFQYDQVSERNLSALSTL